MSLRGLESEVTGRGFRILSTTFPGDHPDCDRCVMDALFPNGKIRATVEGQFKVRGSVAKGSSAEEIRRTLLTQLIAVLDQPQPEPVLQATDFLAPGIVADDVPEPTPDVPVTIEAEPSESPKKRKGKK